ncbi:MAG: cyclic nucleotide-binding protein [Sphingomonas sp.]|mgnify:CR=1 FL=1|nr:cyclic nucleotide-binding protein [Sphingomonas sp.]
MQNTARLHYATPTPDMRAPAKGPADPVILRLRTLVELDARDIAALSDHAVRTRRSVPPRRELVGEGEAVKRPIMVLSGWGARVRLLSDGRRQLLSLLLPGEFVCGRTPESPCSSAVVALTEMTICDAPDPQDLPHESALHSAYIVAAEVDEYHLLAQITRLGRMTAYERCADFLLEVGERLSLAGLTDHNSYSLPLTQDCLADVLGLTNVHVNRTLQALRRDKIIRTMRGSVTLLNPNALARQVDRRPAPCFRRGAA